MKKLHTMKDELLDVHYDVYSMSLQELAKQIKTSYGFEHRDYMRFNTEYYIPEREEDGARSNWRSYQELIQDKEKMKNGMGRVYGYTEEELNLHIQKAEENINQKNFRENEKIFSEFAYEMFPIVVSQTENGYELLDGYRRLFFTNPLPDREVLVKVYQNINDVQWMKMMVMFNSWKFEKGVRVFFDRGVSLGLYYRYDIDFSQFYGYDTFFLNSMLDCYVNHKFYPTLWGNDCFHTDLKALKELLIWKPVFKYQTKRKKIELDCSTMSNEEITELYPKFIIKMVERIAYYFGRLRREETKQLAEGTIEKRKIVTFEDILYVLEKEELQQEYFKMRDMTVGGHIENRIVEKVIPILSEKVGFFIKGREW